MTAELGEEDVDARGAVAGVEQTTFATATGTATSAIPAEAVERTTASPLGKTTESAKEPDEEVHAASAERTFATAIGTAMSAITAEAVERTTASPFRKTTESAKGPNDEVQAATAEQTAKAPTSAPCVESPEAEHEEAPQSGRTAVCSPAREEASAFEKAAASCVFATEEAPGAAAAENRNSLACAREVRRFMSRSLSAEGRSRGTPPAHRA
jgi:hypothetical protein